MNTVRYVLCMVLVSVSTGSQAALQLPLMFSDGAVLQRERPVRVWGWAEPGAPVQAAFDGDTARATTGDDGRWELTLPARKAGGPYTLEIKSGGERVSVRNVAVGDVWICSGQSNMEFALADALDAAAKIKAAGDPDLRHFKVPHSWAPEAARRLAGGRWEAATPETAGDFTAVGYFFARELRAETGVPVGLINSSWSGSRIEAWMDGDALGLEKQALDAHLSSVLDAQERSFEAVRKKLERWKTSEEGGIVEGRAVWADPGLDDRDWVPVPVPAFWEQAGFEGMDGVAWYRTAFKLSAEEAAAGIALGVGKIDDSDRTWVNGNEVGATEQSWDVARTYSVTPDALKAGLNTLAVRVEDTGGGGGIHGDSALVFVQAPGREPRALPKRWKFKADRVRVSADDRQNHIETLLYNKMIHPLHAYPIKGVIWYQGESNADADSAFEYRDRFAAMIRSWRAAWGQGDVPFLWVQLANFISGADTAEASPWAVLRESQSAVLSLPNTAQAVTIDVGNPGDIHPRNKQAVGHRLALAALNGVYGKDDIVYSGPTLRDSRIHGGTVVLSFDHAGSGLAVRGGGELKGFTIAGADRRFKPAEAQIDGNRVVVSRADIPRPVAVRYAWSDNPEAANLMNADSLPASPFRTDRGGLSRTGRDDPPKSL